MAALSAYYRQLQQLVENLDGPVADNDAGGIESGARQVASLAAEIADMAPRVIGDKSMTHLERKDRYIDASAAEDGAVAWLRDAVAAAEAAIEACRQAFGFYESNDYEGSNPDVDLQRLSRICEDFVGRAGEFKAAPRLERKDAREQLQDALAEVQALQREDRPDVDMLTDLRSEVEGIGRRETDENLVEAADRLLEAIDELIARAETADGMRDGAANDKAAPKGGRDGAHKLYA